jgi:hypothetical protein
MKAKLKKAVNDLSGPLRQAARIRNNDNKTPLQVARQIISAWSGKNKHPLVGKLSNFEDYKRCVKLLQNAEKSMKR